MTRTNGRTNGSGAAQSQKTMLQFAGKAQGVKVNIAKSNYDTGSIDITFRVESPKRPTDPFQYGNRNEWQVKEAREVLAGYGGERPDPKEDKKGAAAFDKAQELIETVTNQERAQKVKYARELAAHAPALMGYAQLVGLMAVFSDQRLVITLEPADQDLLPGMGVMLALPDSQASAGRDDEDLDDFDEDSDAHDGEQGEAAAEMVTAGAEA